jgi:23S rRNA (pseudouridine1915-N3)-methyltransferase
MVSIGGKPKSALCEALATEYIERTQRYSAVRLETFATEARVVAWTADLRRKGTLKLGLFDRTGKLMSTEEFAGWIAEAGLQSTQRLVLAIGPADGWSRDMLSLADQAIAFGRITLPHELARVVAAEQLYRAFTLLAGHPYHSGH